MGAYLAIERFVWFHRQVRRGGYPNASTLAEHFELSTRTAQRCIDFMRDRLQAPLEYDSSHKGYFYSGESVDLPFLQLSQEEILALLLARKLLTHTAGGFVSRDLNKFSRKLMAGIGHTGLTAERLDEAFSAHWHGYSPVQSQGFRTVLQALVDRRRLQLDYHSPASGETTSRVAEPHHLQHYMASWVLLAWCHLRNDWRKLYLARMSEMVVLPEAFTPRPQSQWQPLLEGAFGIFQGPSHTPVTLCFDPFRAGWVRHQHWHPDQQIRERVDGSLEVTFPVADFREIKQMILQFGSQVEVLAPEALRQEIAEEVRRMVQMYESQAAEDDELDFGDLGLRIEDLNPEE